jgi:hypothetical protein
LFVDLEEKLCLGIPAGCKTSLGRQIHAHSPFTSNCLASSQQIEVFYPTPT